VRNRLDAATRAETPRSTFTVLGVSVDAVQISDVVRLMRGWIADAVGFRFIAVTGFHGVMEARRDLSFKRVLDTADLVVPDGMSLVWLGRREGLDLPRRVYGPELLEAFCRDTGGNYTHFFLGGAPGVAERLATTLRNRYGIRVAGVLSPPFHPLSTAEHEDIVAKINAASPDVLWVGISTPKQERWLYDHRLVLRIPIGVGIGAAFDFVSGEKRSAPTWMQDRGLEWLFRLASEPRRLWRRYLVGGSRFVYWIALERLGIRRSDHGERGSDDR
jgi:N-acetylglucosaminyldiphosphoundecaprenol N-acetyl-beta-D-mannosaminyltransferase